MLLILVFFLFIWIAFSYIFFSLLKLPEIAQRGINMKTPNDIWGELGELPEEEVMQVMTKLFALYEDRLNKNPEDQNALNFFINLNNAIEQTSQCNLNRR